MKKGNMALAGVAAVVIVICLVFAFITLTDDGGDSGDGSAGYDVDTLRTDVVPGDYYVLEVSGEVAGQPTSSEVTMLAVDVEGDYALVQIGGDAPSWMDAGLFANVQPEGLQPVRTEVIDTAFGERECRVYADPDVEGSYYWYSNGCIYRLQMELFGGTFVADVVENTLYSDAPVRPEQAEVKELEVGDWMTYDTYLFDPYGDQMRVASTSQEVVTVDGDDVVVGTVEDGADLGTQTLPTEVFLTGIDPWFESSVVGTTSFIVDGVMVGCDIVTATDGTFTITAYQTGGMTLMAVSEYEGYSSMIIVTGTNLI